MGGQVVQIGVVASVKYNSSQLPIASFGKPPPANVPKKVDHVIWHWLLNLQIIEEAIKFDARKNAPFPGFTTGKLLEPLYPAKNKFPDLSQTIEFALSEQQPPIYVHHVFWQVELSLNINPQAAALTFW
jgi:hypothetical protein